MAMSKRHFEKLARILRDEAEKLEPRTAGPSEIPAEYLNGRRDGLEQMKQAIAYFCAGENDRFDRQRFLAACEPK